jgi:hypothetical protein
MTDDQLRSLVRDAVARHLAGRSSATECPGSAAPHAGPLPASFHRYALPRGDDGDGPCLIEPTVRCNHCGYCQSHGY